MSWLKTPDEIADGDDWWIATKDGRALHQAVSIIGAKENSDGLVTAIKLKRGATLAEVAKPAKAAAALVEAGWFHTPETMCGECKANATVKPGPGEFYVHRWWKDQISKASKHDPIVKDRQLRRQKLYENKQLCRQIRERDRDLCRYCGVLTLWPVEGTRGGDHRSKTAGTFDHKDPFGNNSLANVVVACRTCNGRKKDRTPEQWVAAGGLALLPEPIKPRPNERFENQTGDQSIQLENQAAEPNAPSRDARDGPGLVGVGSGIGRNESGPNGPGLVGPDRARPGPSSGGDQ